MNKRIKIIGKDGQGWSIDKDRFYNERAIKELNFKTTKCLLNANIIYSVWYSYILKIKYFPLRIFKGNRKIGKKVFMQGGVCYNKAVQASCEKHHVWKIIVGLSQH